MFFGPDALGSILTFLILSKNFKKEESLPPISTIKSFLEFFFKFFLIKFLKLINYLFEYLIALLLFII